MSTSPTSLHRRRPVGLLRRWAALRRARADDGFVLLEAIMAIAMITVIMTALTTLFVTTMTSAAHSRGQQAAIQVATSAVEYARGVGAGGAVSGRDAASVTLQWAQPLASSAPVKPWLASMAPARDLRGPGLAQALPTTAVPQTINGVDYHKNYFIGWCWRPLVDGPDTAECGPAPVNDIKSVQYVRAVVAVTWNDRSCADGMCTYLTAILLNGTSEPTFNFNTAPPPLPTLTCVNLSLAVGDRVDRSILASDGPAIPGCTRGGGLPTFTFKAVGLPPGLSMAGDGNVSGTAAATSTSTVTVTMWDGFLRPVIAAPFTWTVGPGLTITAPTDQSNEVNRAISAVTAMATGGDGAPYTWTASGLPTGIALSAGGTFTGTPAAVGASTVTLTVRDKSGTRTANTNFTWTVTAAPLKATNPGPQVSTVNQPMTSLLLVATGGSGTYVWTDSGSTLPKGLRVSGNRITGTPTGPVGRRSVTLTLTDTPTNQSQTVTFEWIVNNGDIGPLFVANPGDQFTAINANAALQLTASGGSGSYVWSDTGGTLPIGLTVSSSGLISGTPRVAKRTPVVLSFTDSVSPAVTIQFNWTVWPALTSSLPGSISGSYQQYRYFRYYATIDLAGYVSGGSGNYTVRAEALESSNSEGVEINGSELTTSRFLFSSRTAIIKVKLTVTDDAGSAPLVRTFTWVLS